MTGISYGGLLKKQEQPTNLNSPVQGGLRYVPLPSPSPRTLDLGVCLPHTLAISATWNVFRLEMDLCTIYNNRGTVRL
jgi:hypothetical protein